MPTTTELLTKDDLRLLLQDIVSRFPDAKNPTDEKGKCLYFGPDNTHCLIGQLAVEQGWTISPNDNFLHFNAADDLATFNGWPVTEDARWCLATVQRNADIATPAWKDVLL